ncbi:hypothetical protein J2S00_000161 [Caldalkalibacillus uzonensis]|uniref:Uncharacterized protein n=2 Tax=Caldalkalibacillus uzonensis TaxID=353224 RepID=A0ABU0CLU8_9BACI|nr:hypothetical protein [Caldalkalibacillus uzonensis]
MQLRGVMGDLLKLDAGIIVDFQFYADMWSILGGFSLGVLLISIAGYAGGLGWAALLGWFAIKLRSQSA